MAINVVYRPKWRFATLELIRENSNYLKEPGRLIMGGLYSSNWYGEKTLMLKKDPNFIQSIFGIHDSVKWCQDKIDRCATTEPELKIICGEGNIIDTVVFYAIDKGYDYNISIISGDLEEEKKKKLQSLKQEGGKINFYQTKERPKFHFSIIGNNFLYLEDLHEKNERPNSLGITNPYDLAFYKTYYEEQLKNANSSN